MYKQISIVMLASAISLIIISANTNVSAKITFNSPEEKAKFCDPNSAHMQSVNTSEANACGIPKNLPSNTTSAVALAGASTK